MRESERPLRVLVLEDRPADAELMMSELRRQGFAVEWRLVEDREGFLGAIDDSLPELVLSDFALPAFGGLEALALLRERSLDVPFILVSGTIGEDVAVDALHRGADDYLLKGALTRLGAAVDRAMEKQRLRAEARIAEQALRDSQAELATIFENAPVATLIVDGHRRVVKMNRAAHELSGRPADEGFGEVIGDVLRCANALAQPGGCGCGPACPRCPFRAAVLDTLATGLAHRGVECLLPSPPDGSCPELSLLVSTSAVDTVAGRLAMVAVEDISSRIAAERRVRLLNRLLTTIREVNQLVVRERNPGFLLAEACRIVVEHGEFVMAWAGRADWASGAIEPVSAAGRDGGYARQARSRCGDGPRGGGPDGRAIRLRRTVVVNDLSSDPSFEPWREPALARGYHATASLPIIVDDQMFGVISVFSDGSGVFDREIVGLLEELSADLGYALAALEATDRRERAEKELRASEDRFRSLFEQSPTGIYRTTPGGRILDCNPALVQLLGYGSADELASMDVASQGYVSPSDRRGFVERLEREGTVTGHEAAWRRKDGQVVHVRESSRVVRDPSGRALYYEGTVEDITLQKRAEEERDRLFANALDLFAVATFDGHFSQLNPAWERALGWSLGELQSTPFLELVHPEDRDATTKAVEALAGGRHQIGFENRYRRRDGSYRWITWNAHPMVEEGLIFAVARDTTERRQAEEALRVSEDRYRRFFEEDLTADYIAQLDGAVVECNPAFARIFGFADVEEAKRSSMVSLYSRREVRTRLLEELAASGRLENRELELRRRDGRPVFVIANVSMIDGAEDGRRQIKGYMFDITERRRLEEQLLHAQKMEAIGRLAGGIAHDFNNLLQAMLGEVSLIQGDADGAPELAETTDRLIEQIRLGASLTRQLLLFSRRSTTRPEPLDLNVLLHGTSGFLRHLVREDITVDVRTADEPLHVMADRAQLDQVLMNLVVNACDAMPDGGRLTLRCGASDESSVWMSVQDTGGGIPKDILDRVFEPFFTTKSEAKGTGLGLSVVHGIVAAHKGSIAVDSEPGRGTTFRIELPRAAAAELRAAEPEARPEAAPGAAAGERLLLVEDEPAARVALSRLLTAHGYTVTVAGSLEEALATPDEARPRLVLTDLVLPDGRGTDVARALQRRWPDLRVVLMSGYADDSDDFHEISAGSLRFLQKPFDIATLTDELQAALAAPP